MKMQHPDSDQVIEVTKDREDMYASQGWEPAETKKSNKG